MVTIIRNLLLIRFSELGIIDPHYLQMSLQMQEFVWNVRCLQERKSYCSLPLKPISIDGPFQQWGLDFIGEIHPHSSGQHIQQGMQWLLITLLNGLRLFQQGMQHIRL